MAASDLRRSLRDQPSVSLAALLFGLACCASSREDPPPVSVDPGEAPASEVNPFIGTGNAASQAAVLNGATGATFPGAALPFGMVQLSPDTPFAQPHGYHYDDTEIIGFSATHLSGTGCSALRDASLFPSLEPPTTGRAPAPGSPTATRSRRRASTRCCSTPAFWST